MMCCIIEGYFQDTIVDFRLPSRVTQNEKLNSFVINIEIKPCESKPIHLKHISVTLPTRPQVLLADGFDSCTPINKQLTNQIRMINHILQHFQNLKNSCVL